MQFQYWLFSYVMFFAFAKSLSVADYRRLNSLKSKQNPRTQWDVHALWAVSVYKDQNVLCKQHRMQVDVMHCRVSHLNTFPDVTEIPSSDECKRNMSWWQEEGQWDLSERSKPEQKLLWSEWQTCPWEKGGEKECSHSSSAAGPLTSGTNWHVLTTPL